MARFTLVSQLTGKLNSRDIPWNETEVRSWLHSEPGTRPFVQDAFPSLSPEDREFLLTGSTPEEWEELFGGEDDDPDPISAHFPEDSF